MKAQLRHVKRDEFVQCADCGERIHFGQPYEMGYEDTCVRCVKKRDRVSIKTWLLCIFVVAVCIGFWVWLFSNII